MSSSLVRDPMSPPKSGDSLIGDSQGDTRTFGESERSVADVSSQAREDEHGGVGNARRVWKRWARRQEEAFQAIVDPIKSMRTIH